MMPTNILSDSEIDRLLDEAEARLQESAGQVSNTAAEDEISLETGETKKAIKKTYVLDDVSYGYVLMELSGCPNSATDSNRSAI